MNIPTLPLELTGLEIVYLCDSIANSDAAQGLPERDEYLPLAREALLLLGSAYLEVVAPDGIYSGPVELHVSEEVAWLLRGKVKTGSIGLDGTTNIGIGLLRKLYALLLRFNADVSGLPAVTGVDRELGIADRAVLAALKEERDARGSTDPGTDAGT